MNNYNLKVEEQYTIKKINNDKYILNFERLNCCIEQVIINHQKFRDKAFLRTLSKTKLKNLIKRCEEILKESEERW